MAMWKVPSNCRNWNNENSFSIFFRALLIGLSVDSKCLIYALEIDTKNKGLKKDQMFILVHGYIQLIVFIKWSKKKWAHRKL